MFKVIFSGFFNSLNLKSTYGIRMKGMSPIIKPNICYHLLGEPICVKALSHRCFYMTDSAAFDSAAFGGTIVSLLELTFILI